MFGSDGASGSQRVPSVKLSFGFDIRRPSDRRSHIEPLTQLERRTKILLPACLLLDVLQSSSSAHAGEGAHPGHPTEISTRAYEAGDGDMVVLVTFLYRKGHIVMVRKSTGSFKGFCGVNFCVGILVGMVHGEG